MLIGALFSNSHDAKPATPVADQIKVLEDSDADGDMKTARE